MNSLKTTSFWFGSSTENEMKDYSEGDRNLKSKRETANALWRSKRNILLYTQTQNGDLIFHVHITDSNRQEKTSILQYPGAKIEDFEV